jgi:predicted kinase
MQAEMRPLLFYTVGFPGAGKTTLARGLATLLAAKHLRGDKIGLELFRIPSFSPQERQMVFEEMSRRTAASLQAAQHVVYDAATNTVAQRARIIQLAQDSGGEAVGLWIQTPIPLAKKRASQARDSGIVGAVVRVIPPHIFDQYAAAFEPPAEHEYIVALSGDARFYLQYRRLCRDLKRQGVRLPILI